MLPAKLDTGKLEILDRNDGDKSGRDLGDGRRSHRFVLGVAAYETGGDRRAAARGHVPVAVGAGAQRRDRAVDRQHPAAGRAGRGSTPSRSRSGRRARRGSRTSAWCARSSGAASASAAPSCSWSPACSSGARGGGARPRPPRRRRPTVPRRAPDAVAIEKLTALRAARQLRRRRLPAVLLRAHRDRARVSRRALRLRRARDDDDRGARRARNSARCTSWPRARRCRASSPTCDLVKFAKAGSTDAAALTRARRGAVDRAVDGGAARDRGAVDLGSGAPARGPDRRPRRRAPGQKARAVDQRRVWRALAPYLLTLAIALPFAVYYFVQLRGPDIHWRNKGAFVLLAAVPLGAWVGFYLERRRVGTMAFSRTHDLVATSQGAVRLPHAPAARLPARRHRAGRGGAGAAAAPVDRSRPRSRASTSSSRSTCRTRCARPTSVPDRITAAKRVIDRFIERNSTDRIGLVIFGKEAFTQCPLTLDTHAGRGPA